MSDADGSRVGDAVGASVEESREHRVSHHVQPDLQAARAPRARTWSWLVGFLAVGAVLLPAVSPGATDSFPLSTYPMFSRRLDEPRLDRFVGRTAEGEIVLIAPRLLGTREPLQAAAIARRAANGPLEGRRALCGDVARRVAGDATLAEVVRIEVLRERWRLDSFDGRHVPEPVSRTRRVHCEVPR